MGETDTEMLKQQTTRPINQLAFSAVDTHSELPIDPDIVQPGSYKWPPHFSPLLLAAVFIGGTVGTLARYSVDIVMPGGTNSLPAATLFVNLLGAFLLGLLLGALSQNGPEQKKTQLLRLGVGTGFLGAFTTYGTFALESYRLLRQGSIGLAFVYITLSLVGGLLLSALGIKLATVYHSRKLVQ